jgi:hypothetical protein
MRTFDKRRLRPGGLETGVEAKGEDGEAQALLLNQQSRIPKVSSVLWIRIREPGARSMEIDQNLQINLVSCLSKRFLHLQL